MAKVDFEFYKEIPESFDTKEYTEGGLLSEDTPRFITRSGHVVILDQIKPCNSAGHAVTFPIKGIVVISKGRIKKHIYQVWSPFGKASVLAEHEHDLLHFEPLLGLHAFKLEADWLRFEMLK